MPPLAGSDVPLFDIRMSALTRDSVAVNPATVFSWDVEDDQFSPLPGMGFFNSTGAAWSAWTPFTLAAANDAVTKTPNAQAAGFPLTLAVGVTPNGLQTMEIGVEVRFNVNGVTWSMSPVKIGREYYGGNLAFSGMLLYIYLAADGTPVAQRGRDWNNTFVWTPPAASIVPVGRRPKQLVIIDSIQRRGDEIDYVGEAGAALLSFGYTVPEFPASAQYRAALVAAGMSRIRQSLAIILNAYNDYGLTGVPALLAAWAAKYFGVYVTVAGYAGTDVASLSIQDEPGWILPRDRTALVSDATALARFQGYLRGDYATTFGPPAGFTPTDFGQATWGAVQPVGRSAVILGSEGVAARRLFYWSQRFYAWDAARYTAAATAAIQAVLGLATIPPTSTNWNNYQGRFYCPWFGANNPNSGDPDASSGAHDWWEFSRLGGGGVMYSEDWFQDGVAWLTSYYVSRLRSAAAAGGRRFGTYQIPLRANPRPNGPLQKFAAAVGNGATDIFHYKIGPVPLEAQVSYSPIDPTAIPNIAASHRFVAPAEPYVVGATLQGCTPGRVAILAPRTSYAYDLRTEASGLHQCGDTTWSPWFYSMDYIVDQFGVWKALTDSGIPCDFIDEDQLTAPGLAPYSVLYLTEQHLQAERVQMHAAVVAWMNAGGTLAQALNAGSRDELDAANTVIETATGIVANARTQAYSHNDADASAGTVTGPGGTATIYGPKATMSATGGATVYATRSDAAPAILVKPVGAGRVVYYTFNAGMSYWRSRAASSDGQPPGFSVDLTHGFSSLLRTWIAYPTTLAGIVAPATCNTREVELRVWRSAAGVCVYCGNWTAADVPGFQVTVPLVATAGARLASGLPLAVAMSGGNLTATFTLRDPADFLILPAAPAPVLHATATLKVALKRPLPDVLKGAPCRWTSAAAKQERVTVAASGWTPLAPPAGARAVCIVGAVLGMSLAGASGDVGIPLAARVPALLPLGDGVTVGVRNAGAARTVTVYWL